MRPTNPFGFWSALAVAALIVAVGGCATAPKYHPAMVCQFVGPGTLACLDADEVKDRMDQAK